MFRNVQKVLIGLAAGAALALGGSALATAASSQSTTTVTTPSVAAPPANDNWPAHGTAAHEDAEQAVTGDAATKAQAAAVKIVGGGTAGAVTTDMSQTGYEVTVTKSDGSRAEIHLDSSFNELQFGGPHGCPPPPTAGA
jgi:hypothetical protein